MTVPKEPALVTKTGVVSISILFCPTTDKPSPFITCMSYGDWATNKLDLAITAEIVVVFVLVTLSNNNLTPVLLISLAFVPAVKPDPVIVNVILPPSAVWELSGETLVNTGDTKVVVRALVTFFNVPALVSCIISWSFSATLVSSVKPVIIEVFTAALSTAPAAILGCVTASSSTIFVTILSIAISLFIRLNQWLYYTFYHLKSFVLLL